MKHSVVKHSSDQHSVVTVIQRSDTAYSDSDSDTAYSDDHSVVVRESFLYSGHCGLHQKMVDTAELWCYNITPDLHSKDRGIPVMLNEITVELECFYGVYNGPR